MRGRRRSESGYRLDVQAKSTTRSRATKAAIRYDMEARAYEDLRALRPGCPRILVVLVLPEQESEWCGQTEERLLLRHCAYWLSLRGRAPTTNRKSVQVEIPRANVFSAQALQGTMDRIKAGEEP